MLKPSVKQLLAEYVLSLRYAASKPRRSEDRSLYEKYLAEAAVLLALAETSASAERLKEAAVQHEHLWGQTWLVDEVYKTPSALWQTIKRELV